MIGGVLAAHFPPGPRIRSIFQHVAAGVVFAAVAGELLPEITAMHDVTGVPSASHRDCADAGRAQAHGAGRGAGRARSHPKGSSLLSASTCHRWSLGGIGFAAGAEVGVLVTVALTLEVLFLGLATAASLARAGASQPSWSSHRLD